jgi:SAM-dependent methyltransferase
MDGPSLDPRILEYYEASWDEDTRIRSGINELELIRTREIVERFLPDHGLRVLDVGGAAGVHAEWLLESGHSVVLIDPVPRHIAEAESALGDAADFSAQVGDGRHLEFEDDSFDVVLLLGPLYHLPDRYDRLTCWNEAMRVLRPGGWVFAAVISRFASLFSGLSEDVIFDPVFRGVVLQDLLDGHHENPPGQDFFTTAYFHHPDEARTEAEEVGLSVEAVLGVEGIASWIPRLAKSWADPERREIIIEAARTIESEPTLLGLGPHLLVVATNPSNDETTEVR